MSKERFPYVEFMDATNTVVFAPAGTGMSVVLDQFAGLRLTASEVEFIKGRHALFSVIPIPPPS